MATKQLAPIHFHKNIMIGCDPEFFFADAMSGKVVGSEKVLTKGDKQGGLVIDGVQAELNPAASYCRELLAHNISACFKALYAKLRAEGKNLVVKTDSLVEIDQAELNSLSDACQVFGCAPSTNIYNSDENKTSKISVDPKKYLKRSAGGHIHMGNAWNEYLKTPTPENGIEQDAHITAKKIEKALKKMPDTMVAVLDIIVGNTCVLIDRSAGNAERRANYGRAGEYRMKPYGIEYRTLSNFWLRSYQLMSFVTGLCRFAVHIVAESTEGKDYVKALFDAVKRDDVVKAINTNDRTLALQNFKKVQQLFKDWADEMSGANYYPIRSSNLKFFYHFILRIKQKGIEYWFKEDAMTHWCGRYQQCGGWETFLHNNVEVDFNTYAIDLNKRKKSTDHVMTA